MRTEQQKQYAKKVGKRIAYARKAANLSQVDFGIELAKRVHRSKPYTFTTISAWEVGRRVCPSQLINDIAQLCNVDRSYLLCLSDAPDKAEESLPSSSSDPTICIKSSSLSEYNGKPVYLCFEGYEREDCWAIVDDAKQRFIGLFGVLNYGTWIDDIKIYPYTPYYKISDDLENLKKLNVSNIDNIKMCYVVLTTNSDKMRDLYNGWYEIDHEYRILKNKKGFILNLEDIGITYNAYVNYVSDE